ncbi:glycerol-3-phosphate dehydrogenase [Phaeobacter inhibens]|uniref:glycerol-3-phosphate dehydrogenase n=1 Tax=Phaeobacter inhibens TaxID=221822 RepID=UPI0001632761|nr:glycerol-3-phosphate dehydrogenase [Phaeobacter inhibens]AFO90551.1 aerobic glycerol-3-phosphate dehydrogenase GlpD [Phaeobacter inhibens DSM 17395]AUQ45201.1 aerobic glycerol-3-phosphate dehydrogenase GlpD [Phaeobacter inhibens]AXT22069.1 glycerol-3-phosphate dehydrogenase [Phaeobacter inhibens]
MSNTNAQDQITDLFIIGGGINGCGIARDAAGRGLSVALAEMNDLASATSSASTKLFHGGLRYLEYFEFRLVREALIEREVLLKAMPHISWPMRFVLPFHKDMRFDNTTPTSKLLTTIMPWMKGRRPAWLIRLGLFMYDSLGKRGILPGTSKLDLASDPAGRPLDPKFKTAFEYSDCWIEDARLVVLNARDAEARGAEIMTRTKVTGATRNADHWVIDLEDITTGETSQRRAKMLVNAGGPWVADVLRQKLGQNSRESVRLVRGSHIVVPKLYDHGRCYFFQGTDGRIIFAIPYEEDYTLIGTTDADHPDPQTAPTCTPEEQDYLINFASQYFANPLSRDDIVWTYSGVRPLYDDGASSATAATREYVLTLNDSAAPLLNVFGGKITTYRKLAEAALEKIATVFPDLPADWTAGVALPGGDFPVGDVAKLTAKLAQDYPFLSPYATRRLIRAYGTEAWEVLGKATTAADLGEAFGATVTARELDWTIAHEWVRTGEDYLLRRTKLALRLTEAERAAVDSYIRSKAADLAA